MADSQSVIQIRGLRKEFKSKKKTVVALRDIDLDIRYGEIFGIIGMSGAGKSTLVRCMNFLERPTAGNVVVDGLDLAALSRKELCKARHSISMIFQQFNLLMQRTALDNVCFPLEIAGMPKKDAAVKAPQLLELVGLSDKMENYASELSGGQKQRVAIARALATDPKVLLCDEATSALDPTTTKSILALLKDINKNMGITVVIITHEMSVIEEICHRVAILDDSHVVELGEVSDIFANPKSTAARKLVYPGGQSPDIFTGKRCLRIIFDGRSSFEPVIANMVLDCRHTVNIMYADTRDIDGRAVGQMIVQLPDDPAVADRMIKYLAAKQVKMEEVDALV